MDKIKDDWLYPDRRPLTYKRRDPKETPWLIVRLKAPPICAWSGSPPSPSYETWSDFATREERDAELKRLRETTEWTLAPARLNVFGHGWEIEDENFARLQHLLENFDLVPKKTRRKTKQG